VRVVMMQVIQAGKDDQANGPNGSRNDRTYRQSFLEPRCVYCQRSPVSKPAFGHEDEVEGNNSDGPHSNE
jgi:hypothetical protein